MNIGHSPGKFVQRCPKLLCKQAADRFALEVIKYSISAIGKGLHQYYDDPEEWLEIVENIRSIKSWYWEETSKWLGYGCLKLRCMLSKSFMDILDCRKKLKCTLVQRYVIQLLFCCEVGNISNPQDKEIEKKVCAQLTKLIKHIGPFYFEELYDTCFKFESAQVLVSVLNQSPDLKRIHLCYSITSSCFQLLRKNCRYLEVVTIDIENVFNESFDSLKYYLFKTFFGNQGCGSIDFGSLPFEHLKAVCIRYDRLPEILLDFLFFMQQCPNIITQQTCLLALPFNTMQKKIPFVCPSMLIGKDTDIKKVKVFLREAVSSDCVSTHANPVEATCGVSIFNQEFTLSVQEVQRKIANLHTVDSLRYIYCDQGQVVISPAGGVVSETIQELYIFGPLETEREVQNLVRILNLCSRIQVLSLQLEINIVTDIRHLNVLKDLRVLSVSITQFSQYRRSLARKEPLPLHITQNFIVPLIRAAPNLNTLEIPGKCDLPALLDLEPVSNIHTLSLTDGDVEEVKPFLINLPSLCVLVLDTDFGHKRYLRIKKAFRCTQLKVVFKRSRTVFPFT